MKIAHWVSLGLLLVIAIIVGYWAIHPITAPTWTGFGPYNEQLQGPRAKTLWDWLYLIIIPLVLAMGAWILSSVDKDAEKRNEADRQNQDTLNSLLDDLSDLLLVQHLRTSDPDAEVRSIARSYARSAFRQLDPNRKAEALQFLHEARLIETSPTINLNGANLKRIFLKNAVLSGAEILGAYFDNSCLRKANISNANFCGSNFNGADFRGAILENTDLSFTFLIGANFKNCDLTKTNLTGAILIKANLSGTKLLPAQRESIVV
jgi:uncharacterized protein YjbI with pentapeptide repeats